jgi:hypothetical protein
MHPYLLVCKIPVSMTECVSIFLQPNPPLNVLWVIHAQDLALIEDPI